MSTKNEGRYVSQILNFVILHLTLGRPFTNQPISILFIFAGRLFELRIPPLKVFDRLVPLFTDIVLQALFDGLSANAN